MRARGNDRHPKGRDAEQLGCALSGAGERDPTNGRGPPIMFSYPDISGTSLALLQGANF